MSAKRTSLGKRARFSVFERDGFTCQYCGRMPPEVVLHVDHIIPVFEGGTNDPENLTTSCDSCNLGKWKTTIGKPPNPMDEARRSQECLEAIQTAKLFSDAMQARKRLRSDICDMICELTDQKECLISSITSVSSAIDLLGINRVIELITSAARTVGHGRCPDERNMIKYFHGCVRNVINEGVE